MDVHEELLEDLDLCRRRHGQALARVGAERAERIGLVSAVVPRESLLEDSKSLLRKVTRNGPVAVRMALESIYRALDTATTDALDYESSLFGLLASTEDMKEGMSAFMEKRKADFKGR